MGDLRNAEIKKQWEKVFNSFPFSKVHEAINSLIA
jgi:hypothetical protein